MKPIEKWAHEYAEIRHKDTVGIEKEVAIEAYIMGAQAMRSKIRREMRKIGRGEAADFTYAKLWDIGEVPFEDLHGSDRETKRS